MERFECAITHNWPGLLASTHPGRARDPILFPMKRNNRTSKRNARARRGSSVPRSLGLSDGPAYAGQQTARLRVPGFSGIFSTTVTTGVISGSLVLGPAAIVDFATRFGKTFDEYRILGADVMIRPLSVSTGVTRFFFDEKSATAPTIDDSQERIGLSLPNNSANVKSAALMTWRARDLLDLEYTPIGTDSTPAYWKLYTDTATWGAPTAVTALWLAVIDFHIEFRGLRGAN